MFLSRDQLDGLTALYDDGKLLTCYEQARAIAPLAEWEGPEALVLAGRLTGQLGGATAGYWRIRQAFRKHPESFLARYYHGYRVWRAKGPYAAWRWTGEFGEPPADADAELRSSWYVMRGEIAGMLRDFEVAEEWLRRASETAPTSPWVKLGWAEIYEHEDRYEEALAAGRESLALRPWYRPAVQSVAHLLTLLGRDAEAIALLKDGLARIESGAIAGHLYTILKEEERYDEAAVALAEFARLSPLLEKPGRKWLAAQQADLAYFRGDLPEAARLARDSDLEFYKELAERLSQPEAAARKRVRLPIGFVRQHRVTCAPATLATITNFWSMPTDHLRVAEEICYNGTSHYNERKWAREHGWHAREFTVTPESAAALIDAGIPFTFTTVEPGSGHLQAVIGYDARRGTLLFRDPFWRNSGEAFTEKILEHYRAFGPRGMALVPVAERARLEALELPDAALWDLMHELDDALEHYRRDEAQGTLDKLAAAGADHYLALEGARRLAIYDGNPAARLAVVDKQLARCPDNAALQLERLYLLRNQVERDERLKILAEQCAKKDSHPIFWQQYAEELRLDARRAAETHFFVRRSVTRWGADPRGYHLLASLYWDHLRFVEALELYRFAACLGDKEEYAAQSYFTAAGWFKRQDEVLVFLEDRFRRFGKKDGAPGRTLISAYLRRDRFLEARRALEQALELRPDDGELLLFAADTYLALSMEHAPLAQELLERARPRVAKGDWLRAAARLAALEGRNADALALWREIVELQPLSVEAHSHVARLLAMTSGQAAALAHLRAGVDRFPHHYLLHQQWLEWLRDEPVEVFEPAIRRTLEVNPDDAWVHRELAFLLANTRRFDEARAEAQHGLALEPNTPASHLSMAFVERDDNHLREAQAAARRAVELGIDHERAMSLVVELAPTRAERREAVEFLRQELAKQVIFGEALLSFREVARGVYEPDELLAVLREAHVARPDLWHAWSALVLQLTAMDQLDEAQRVIVEATERFPLLPRLWLDRASLARMQGDPEAELDCLRTSYRISPSYAAGVKALCDALERQGDYAEARQLLENATSRNSLDSDLSCLLAEGLWRAGEREAAADRVERVVSQEPSCQQAWRMLDYYCSELGAPERSLTVARRLAEQRPGEARSWMLLGRMLDGEEHLEERLAAIERALVLNPQLWEAHDLRAVAMADAKRWDESLAACEPADWKGDRPLELKSRRAWVLAQRGDADEAKALYRAVLAEEPHYWWAAKNLADLCRESPSAADYLAAAETLVRINPLSEMSFGYLADARERSNDREGAKEAYRRAFEITPSYEFAGLSVFDMELEDKQLDGAAETLDMLLKHGRAPIVLARQVQLEAARGDRAAALAVLREILAEPEQGPWPVRTALEALGAAGGEEEAEETLRAAVAAEGCDEGHAASWVSLAHERFHEKKGTANDWLARLPAIEERHPAISDLHDLRAMLLTRDNRFDEALAACQPSVFNGAPPCNLLGRAAWVVAQRGQPAEAIARFRELLAKEPDYHWGWQQLANLCCDEGDYDGYLAAAEAMVRLRPKSSDGHEFVGHARQLKDDAEGAVAAYRQALEVSPQAQFAARELLGLQVQRGELAEARATLHALQPRCDTPGVRAREVELLCAEGRLGEAVPVFGKLTIESNGWAIQTAFDAICEQGGEGSAAEMLRAALDTGDMHEAAADCYGRTLCSSRRIHGPGDITRAAAELRALAPRPALFAAAVEGSLREIRASGSIQNFRDLAVALRGQLLLSARAWGNVVQAACILRDYEFIRPYIHDWRAKAGLEPWMLVGVAETCWATGNPAEAVECSRFGLSLPADSRSSILESFLALDAALGGRLEEADSRLAKAHSATHADYVVVRKFAEIVLASERDEGPAASRFESLLARLDRARDAYPDFAVEAGRQDFYWRALWKIVRRQGSLWQWLWCWSDYLRSRMRSEG